MDMKEVALQELFPKAEHPSVLQKFSKVLFMIDPTNSAFGWTQPRFSLSPSVYNWLTP